MISSSQLKRSLAIAHDIVAVTFCWFAAYWLRFNLVIPDTFMQAAIGSLAVVLAIYVPACWWFGLYRGIWRYATVMDLRRILFAVSFASVAVVAVVFLARLPLVPRSVLILHPLLLILAMGGSRFIYRAWRDQRLYGRLTLVGEPVLILGPVS